MTVRLGMRGQPLLALLVIIGCWVGARALLWDVKAFAPGAATAPFELSLPGDPPLQAGIDGGFDDVSGPLSQAPLPLLAAAPPPAYRRIEAQPVRGSWPRYPHWTGETRAPDGVTVVAPIGEALTSLRSDVSIRTAAAPDLMWMAVLQMPGSMGMALPLSARAAAPFVPVPQAGAAGRKRWSGDGWLLLRGGSAAIAGAPSSATYGGSQAGAVLRYRLMPDNHHKPTAYLRTTGAVGASGERESALGLSARPFARLPVSAMAELRVSGQARGVRLRPAVMAVSELPPLELPRGLRAESYLQAGYVGGAGATPFIDGQVRVDRPVARIGRADLRAGGGIWGGAQKGARRFDVGPTAAMAMGLGNRAAARLAVDWRFRVAGDAVPASGPALTLSAGF